MATTGVATVGGAGALLNGICSVKQSGKRAVRPHWAKPQVGASPVCVSTGSQSGSAGSLGTSCSYSAWRSSEICGARLKTTSERRVKRQAEKRAEGVTCVLEKEVPDDVFTGRKESFLARLDVVRKSWPAALSESQIWLSDVTGRKQRPYFLNRQWTKKDISYAVYMVGVHGLCLAAPFTFSWDALACFAVMYIITGMLGITLSYHRNLSHKSFKLPKWLEYVFAYCGILAIQGDPLEWVSAHRYHHQHCDTPRDPHTPYEGFWHSHMGWLLDDKRTTERVGVRGNIADMANDPFYQWIEKTYTWHAIASAALLYAIGGWPYLVWGFALRVVWVYHITWAVNSAAHVWGGQSWNTGDLSRNNWWVAILAFGEGWHNNHHAFEYSARHGLEWWQVDVTWYTVKLLEALGLASKVRYPTKEHMAKLTLPKQA